MFRKIPADVQEKSNSCVWGCVGEESPNVRQAHINKLKRPNWPIFSHNPGLKLACGQRMNSFPLNEVFTQNAEIGLDAFGWRLVVESVWAHSKFVTNQMYILSSMLWTLFTWSPTLLLWVLNIESLLPRVSGAFMVSAEVEIVVRLLVRLLTGLM
jgi:hypothetical protein